MRLSAQYKSWYVRRYEESAHIQQHLWGAIDLVDKLKEKEKKGKERKGKDCSGQQQVKVQLAAFVPVWRPTVGGTAAASNTHLPRLRNRRSRLTMKKSKTQQTRLLVVHLRSASRC